MTHKAVIGIILVVQVLCAFFFVSQIMASVLGLAYQPLDWAFVELIEIGAAVGLIIGVVLGGISLRESFRRTHRAEEALRRASAAFMEVLEERFTAWGLTPAERDVALFAIKGMSTQEIATLRSTSEGTVKAQTNAIYRKAGVTGRPQLLSLFIEDMMDQDAPRPALKVSA
jgi:DNA-binding CsgD family transcriptional regulator